MKKLLTLLIAFKCVSTISGFVNSFPTYNKKMYHPIYYSFHKCLQHKPKVNMRMVYENAKIENNTIINITNTKNTSYSIIDNIDGVTTKLLKWYIHGITNIKMLWNNNHEEETHNQKNTTKVFKMRYSNEQYFEERKNEINRLLFKLYIYAVIYMIVIQHMIRTYFQKF